MRPHAVVPVLSPVQRAHLERRLRQERALALASLARYGRETHATPDGRDPAQAALDAAFASRETATLVEIEAALYRLECEPDAFGLDELTGESIPFERLDLVPWARQRARPTGTDVAA